MGGSRNKNGMGQDMKEKERAKKKGEKAWKTESQREHGYDNSRFCFGSTADQWSDLASWFVFALSMKIVCRILGWPLLWPHYLSCVTALIFSIDHIRCSLSRNEKENVMHHSNTHCTISDTPGWANQSNFVKSRYLLGIIARQKNITYTLLLSIYVLLLFIPPYQNLLTSIHQCMNLNLYLLQQKQYRRTHTHAHSQHKVNTHINHTCNIISINTGDE